MKIIIIGAGEVGFHLASWLSKEDKDIIVIDESIERLKRIENSMDVKTIHGGGNNFSILKQAEAENADILIAVTNIDEVNMISCLAADINFNIPQKISRIRNLDYIKTPIMIKQLGIDLAINPEQEVTKTIHSLMEYPDILELFDFEDGKVVVADFKVDENTPIANKKLIDFGKSLPKPNDRPFLIVGLVRSDKMIIPKGEHEVLPNDHVYLITKKNDLPHITKYFKKEEFKLKNIMIGGGGRFGELVTSDLEKMDLKIKVIEPNKKRAYELSDILNKAVVINSSQTDIKVLKHENIEDMDCFIAVSEDEEENIFSCLMAKHLGVPKTICLVNNSDYVPIARSIGIDSVISPRLATANVILKLIRKGNVLNLTTLRDNDAEVIEVIAQKNSGILNKQINDMHFPDDALIGTIIRNDKIIIPKGDDYIRPDDRVIIFALNKAISSVEKLLKPKSHIHAVINEAIIDIKNKKII